MKNENPGIAGCYPWPGWAGLDPSNAMTTGNERIALAQGRGNAGIFPAAGIIAGSREQDVDVNVDVVPRA